MSIMLSQRFRLLLDRILPGQVEKPDLLNVNLDLRDQGARQLGSPGR
jgi:hypothetical protein